MEVIWKEMQVLCHSIIGEFNQSRCYNIIILESDCKLLGRFWIKPVICLTQLFVSDSVLYWL